MGRRWTDTGAPWTARERAAYRKGAEKAEARLGEEIKRLNERIAEMENRSFNVTGIPMTELGLQCAVIVHPDGRRERMMGFVVMEGQTIADAIEEEMAHHPGASLVIEHEWIPHYRIGEGQPDGYVCKHCPAVREPELRPDLPDGATLPNGMKNQTTSAHRFMGKSVIWGKDGEHATAYMTRYWIGRLRLHVFHRGDQDPDAHDHPWGFWTFPFTPYVEEVVEPTTDGYRKRLQIVPAWRPNYRPATHTHRVLGRYAGFRDMGVPVIDMRPIVTLVWRGKDERKWGFLKHRDGRWCWVHWKSYVFGGGKSAPCE